MLATLALVWVFVQNHSPQYRTAIGEQRIVKLEDGSIVTLNTRSQIKVRFERDRRRIDLIEGEALFEVAHDTARPFQVFAGTAEVRAVEREDIKRLHELEQNVDLMLLGDGDWQPVPLASFEKEYVTRLVSRASGNMSRAARLASVDRTTLYRLLERHGFRRDASETIAP